MSQETISPACNIYRQISSTFLEHSLKHHHSRSFAALLLTSISRNSYLFAVSYKILKQQSVFVDFILPFFDTLSIVVCCQNLGSFAFSHLHIDALLKSQLIPDKRRRRNFFLKEVSPDHPQECLIIKNMEQNQSKTHPSISSIPLDSQGQWEKVRRQFANSQQSISEIDRAAELVEKWIWIQHEQEFEGYKSQLKKRSEPPQHFKQIIVQILQQEKQDSVIFSQKFQLPQINAIIAQFRLTLCDILKEEGEINPQTNRYIETSKEELTYSNSPVRQTPSEKEGQLTNSIVLPEIRSKGRVYLPNQMPTSFHLLKETEEDYKSRSPHMFAREEKPKVINSSIFNNKFLKKTFTWFCKQGYNPKGLFQDYSKEADRMSLNKWMIFCKEFGFNDKFHKKDLIGIFQSAGKFSSSILVEDFLTAVALLQEKYTNKFHKGDDNFVAEILQIGNEASFRVKMDNLKISYAGPRRNFFEYGAYFQHERADEIQREKSFQAKKKEREIVLIKGMFEDHLKDQLKDLKAKRQKNKSTRLDASLNTSRLNLQKKRKEETASQVKTSRIRVQDINYSKLFHISRGQATQKEPYTTSTETQFTEKKAYKTDLAKTQTMPKIHKKIESQPRKNIVQAKILATNFAKSALITNDPIQQRQQSHQQHNTWLTNIRSDSQESDDILKEHLDFQKSKNPRGKMADLMAQMKERSKKVQNIKQQIHKDNQADQDMVQTQVNFKRDRQLFS